MVTGKPVRLITLPTVRVLPRSGPPSLQCRRLMMNTFDFSAAGENGSLSPPLLGGVYSGGGVVDILCRSDKPALLPIKLSRKSLCGSAKCQSHR